MEVDLARQKTKKNTHMHTYTNINEETNTYNYLNSPRWRILNSIPPWSSGESGERLHTIKETATLTGGLTFWRRNFFLILAHPVYKM